MLVPVSGQEHIGLQNLYFVPSPFAEDGANRRACVLGSTFHRGPCCQPLVGRFDASLFARAELKPQDQTFVSRRDRTFSWQHFLMYIEWQTQEQVSSQEKGTLQTPHEPIREDLVRMERLLQAPFFDGTQPWKVAAFFKWYNEWFSFTVNHHHNIEETIFFPAVKARCGEIPARMSADHEGLIHMLQQISSMEVRFKSLTEGSPELPLRKRRILAEELRQKVAHMGAELRKHLDEEERFFTPVVREHFTKEEHQQPCWLPSRNGRRRRQNHWSSLYRHGRSLEDSSEESPFLPSTSPTLSRPPMQLIGQVIKAHGLSGNVKMCPWVVHSMYKWAGKDYVEKEFRPGMPAPVRFLLDYFWYPAYVKHGLHGLDVLELDADPKTSAGKSFWSFGG